MAETQPRPFWAYERNVVEDEIEPRLKYAAQRLRKLQKTQNEPHWTDEDEHAQEDEFVWDDGHSVPQNEAIEKSVEFLEGEVRQLCQVGGDLLENALTAIESVHPQDESAPQDEEALKHREEMREEMAKHLELGGGLSAAKGFLTGMKSGFGLWGKSNRSVKGSREDFSSAYWIDSERERITGDLKKLSELCGDYFQKQPVSVREAAALSAPPAAAEETLKKIRVHQTFDTLIAKGLREIRWAFFDELAHVLLRIVRVMEDLDYTDRHPDLKKQLTPEIFHKLVGEPGKKEDPPLDFKSTMERLKNRLNRVVDEVTFSDARVHAQMGEDFASLIREVVVFFAHSFGEKDTCFSHLRISAEALHDHSKSHEATPVQRVCMDSFNTPRFTYETVRDLVVTLNGNEGETRKGSLGNDESQTDFYSEKEVTMLIGDEEIQEELEIYQKDPISALCSRVADEYDVLHKIDRLEQAVENWARNDDNWRLFASIHKHFANMKRHRADGLGLKGTKLLQLETLLRKVPKVNGGKIGGKLALPSGSSIRTQQKKVQTKKKLQNRKEKDPKNKKEESQHPSGLLQTEAEAQGRPAFSPEELRTNEPLKILCVETTGDADDETTRSLCTKPPLLPSLKAEQQKQVDRALPFQGGLGRLLMSVAFICLSADVRRLAPSQTQLRLVQTTALPSTLQRPHRDAAFLQAPSTAKAKDKDRDLSQISLLDLDPHASLYSAFPKTTQTAPATDASIALEALETGNRGGLHPIREALLSAFCPDDLESQDASEICANRMQGDLSAFLDEHWQHAPFTALHGGLPVPEPHKEEAEKTLSPSLARPGGYGETTKEQEGTATFGNTVPALPSLKSSAPFEKIRL